MNLFGYVIKSFQYQTRDDSISRVSSYSSHTKPFVEIHSKICLNQAMELTSWIAAWIKQKALLSCKYFNRSSKNMQEM